MGRLSFLIAVIQTSTIQKILWCPKNKGRKKRILSDLADIWLVVQYTTVACSPNYKLHSAVLHQPHECQHKTVFGYKSRQSLMQVSQELFHHKVTFSSYTFYPELPEIQFHFTPVSQKISNRLERNCCNYAAFSGSMTLLAQAAKWVPAVPVKMRNT